MTAKPQEAFGFRTLTPKERAEAYVRSKCPELMELSFGCEVEIDGVKQRVGGGVQLNGDGTERYFEGCGCCGGYLDCETKVIGHPIQLQHWLRVLVPVVYKMHFHGNMYVTVTPEKDEHPNIQFNLTTGQPATEADWIALCDILGI